MGKMQYYTVKDYVELLEKRGMLLENRVEGEEDHVIRNLTYNSKEAGADTMFICKGVNIYPQQIEDVLMRFPEVGRNYLILLDNDNVGDVLRVQVEIREEYFVEDLRVLRGLQARIAHALKNEILVTPRIELVQSNSLPVSEGKAVRFRDQRNSK